VPRHPRIEFAGAFYHVMCRGDRREAIVQDDQDRRRFIETLGEACEKTGWRVHAWVLMDNHYHWLLETPEGNLVEGMKWFQNAYTRRYNSRHKTWGHVFGGRYKSILVEDREDNSRGYNYLLTLGDYIHLNPVRAGLTSNGSENALLGYEWSSLKRVYGVPKAMRPVWCDVERLLSSDTTKARRAYFKRLEAKIADKKLIENPPEGQTLNSTLNRGWYWGSQEFREKVAKLHMATAGGHASVNRNRNEVDITRHDISEASKLLERGLKHLKLTSKELRESRGSHPKKVAIALAIKTRTTAPLRWIAEKLSMKSSLNVSQQLTRYRKGHIKLGKAEKKWLQSVNIIT
jgi:putative transposase